MISSVLTIATLSWYTMWHDGSHVEINAPILKFQAESDIALGQNLSAANGECCVYMVITPVAALSILTNNSVKANTALQHIGTGQFNT